MLALLSSPLRRWLLATLLLPVAAFAMSKLGLFLQRRNGGTPTRFPGRCSRLRRSPAAGAADEMTIRHKRSTRRRQQPLSRRPASTLTPDSAAPAQQTRQFALRVKLTKPTAKDT